MAEPGENLIVNLNRARFLRDICPPAFFVRGDLAAVRNDGCSDFFC
jgi:hypothetical protein